MDTYPVIGDVDGDGQREMIVIATEAASPWRRYVHVINASGAIARSMQVVGDIYYGTQAALADLDRDHVPEILVQSNSHINVWKGDGTTFPNFPVNYGSGYQHGNSAPVVGDVDGLAPTPTPTFTRTATLTRTPTFTPSVTPTRTLTFTPSVTPTRTLTFTPSATPTPTATLEHTWTPSLTWTPLPTRTPTHTPRAPIAWFVSTVGTDANDCLTPATACLTLDGTLAKSDLRAGDTIRVAAGVYTDWGSQVVSLDQSVNLSGGWNSNFTEQNGYSTIDAQKARRGITIYNATAQLERFIIENGYTTGVGGGMAISMSQVTLNRTIIRNNTAESGGGIYAYGNLALSESTVSGNVAGHAGRTSPSGGGGIKQSGTLTIIASTISGNTSLGWYKGDGIHASGQVTISNSTISRLRQPPQQRRLQHRLQRVRRHPLQPTCQPRPPRAREPRQPHRP